ncbi:MAG: hypothetical protein QG608_2322 [Actinomycetota bacterium]|nr:hypothetical protein [Actinomycetota bacterium]
MGSHGGGGGNRTRVRQRKTRASPGASCYGFSQPRCSHRQGTEPGSVAVDVLADPATGSDEQWPSSRRRTPGRRHTRADGLSPRLRRRVRSRCAKNWHLLVCDDGSRDHVAFSARFSWINVRRRNLSPPVQLCHPHYPLPRGEAHSAVPHPAVASRSHRPADPLSGRPADSAVGPQTQRSARRLIAREASRLSWRSRRDCRLS